MNRIFVLLEFANGTVGRMQAFVESEDELPEEIAKGVYESPVAQWSICNAGDFPVGNNFRNAWRVVNGAVVIDLDAAKSIVHEQRRLARSAEFAPLDIQATIPSMAIQAEAARQEIRNRYAALQVAINALTTVAELQAVPLAEPYRARPLQESCESRGFDLD